MYSVGIIGAGNIAAGFDEIKSDKILTHAHAIIENDSFVLKGFFDVDANKAETAAVKWNTRVFGTIDELVDGTDVCVCCVPDEHHASIIAQIAKGSPKVIITEKPLADSLEEARRICELYAETQPIAVNYSRRYIPEFQQLKKRIPLYGKLIKGAAYYGKGTFHNGSHIIDLLQFFFGGVESIDRTGLVIDDYAGDLTCDAILTWNDSLVYLLGVDSRIVTVFEADLMFEEARIRIVNGGQRIEVYNKSESNDYKGYYGYELSDVVKVDYSRALEGLYHNIDQFLRGEEQLICGLEEGVSVLDVCSKVRGYD